MNYEIFLERVRARAGLDSHSEAEVVAQTALAELGPLLVNADREVVAGALPEPLAAAWMREHRWERMEVEEFCVRLSEREGITLGFAMEHAQVVCQTLMQSLSPTLRSHLLERVPEGFKTFLGELLAAALDAEVPARVVRGVGRGRTLASGRPGSTRSLAEASWDNAHRHSVARSDNPHSDTKLSSTRRPPGPSNPVASGKPSGRPIAEYRER